ncbi:unnamed protein product, partial [Mesorhabditis spiculigera]
MRTWKPIPLISLLMAVVVVESAARMRRDSTSPVHFRLCGRKLVDELNALCENGQLTHKPGEKTLTEICCEAGKCTKPYLESCSNDLPV